MEDIQLTIDPSDYSLLTDLYQLTMGACYAGEGLDQRWASFELFPVVCQPVLAIRSQWVWLKLWTT